MFKGSLLLLLDSCTTPLPPKQHALMHPPSLSANREGLWFFDLDKSQVRGRYDCLRDIRRSHCQPFCACMFAQLEWAHICTLLIFCLLCVCFWYWGINNSNNFGLGPGFNIWSEKGVPAFPWEDVSCCLIAAALRFGQGWQLSRSANELGLQNFLITWVKVFWRQRLWWPCKFCAQTKTRNVTGVTK
jgi:hypothetical protein